MKASLTDTTKSRVRASYRSMRRAFAIAAAEDLAWDVVGGEVVLTCTRGGAIWVVTPQGELLEGEGHDDEHEQHD